MQNKILPGLRTTFWVHLIVGAIFGLGYLLIPDTLLGIFGMQAADEVPFRMIGAAVCGFAASSFWATRETEWGRVKIVVQMEIVWTVLATLVYLFAILAAGYSASAWVGAIIMALFAVAFGYFYMQESAVRMAAAPH
jgi:hypothetical protein